MTPAAADNLIAAGLILLTVILITFAALAITRGTKAERLADLNRYAPGDERIPAADPGCRWCASLTGDGLDITRDCNCKRACDYPCTWCKRRRQVVRERGRR